MPALNPLTILLVDDHDIVRQGLNALLSRYDDMVVIGEAGTANEAIEQAVLLLPDIVILDIRLPDGSGIEVCREILSQNPEIRILILTSYSDEEALFGSIMSGASGYLLKEIKSGELIESIRKVGSGYSLLDPTVTKRVLNKFRENGSEDKWTKLSNQEQAILELISDGMTNRQISHVMSLSEKTIKNYVSSILNKLELSRRTQAATYLVKRRISRNLTQ